MSCSFRLKTGFIHSLMIWSLNWHSTHICHSSDAYNLLIVPQLQWTVNVQFIFSESFEFFYQDDLILKYMLWTLKAEFIDVSHWGRKSGHVYLHIHGTEAVTKVQTLKWTLDIYNGTDTMCVELVCGTVIFMKRQ